MEGAGGRRGRARAAARSRVSGEAAGVSAIGARRPPRASRAVKRRRTEREKPKTSSAHVDARAVTRKQADRPGMREAAGR